MRCVTKERVQSESLKCLESKQHFIDKYVFIYDKVSKRWIHFNMWPMQRFAQRIYSAESLVIELKARQNGETWNVLAHLLYEFVWHPICQMIFFSKGDAEVVELLKRFRDMYFRLPSWMRVRVNKSNVHTLELQDGSLVKAMSGGGAKSFAATHILIDEADHKRDFKETLRSAEAIIVDDPGLQMILVSTADKNKPVSEFKKVYRSAYKYELDGDKIIVPQRKEGDQLVFASLFLPWMANPNRTQEWHKALITKAMRETGNLDDIHENHPTTDQEALAPRQFNKRIPFKVLERVYWELEPLNDLPEENLNDSYKVRENGVYMRIYAEPEEGIEYVIGSDTCEGNPSSDPSGFVVKERDSGKTVAVCKGKYEPAALGALIAKGSEYYNGAPALVERNNHGHAVILYMKDNTSVFLLCGTDKKPGWVTSTNKVVMYDQYVKACKNYEVSLPEQELFNQLASIEVDTLRAPEGLEDDLAICEVLANLARTLSYSRGPRIW